MVRDPGTDAELRGLRDRIDQVDDELLRVLNERARIVEEVRVHKEKADLPPFDMEREEWILSRVAEANPGPIRDSSVRDIFEFVLRRIRDVKIQREELSK